MELIPAGLGGDKNGGAGAESEFSGVVVGQNLELLNRIDGRENANATGSQFVVVISVEDPVGGVGARAANRERERPAGGDFTARAAVDEAVGIGLLRGAGRQ